MKLLNQKKIEQEILNSPGYDSFFIKSIQDVCHLTNKEKSILLMEIARLIYRVRVEAEDFWGVNNRIDIRNFQFLISVSSSTMIKTTSLPMRTITISYKDKNKKGDEDSCEFLSSLAVIE